MHGCCCASFEHDVCFHSLPFWVSIFINVLPNRLYIGNLGDAEAVIGRQKPEGLVAECVTYKHKPNSPEERERIEKAGGHVVFGRVLGSLAVSRALGDAEFKMPRNKAQDDFVSSVPFLKAYSLGPDVPFMIIACDGLWDKVCCYPLHSLVFSHCSLLSI